MRCSACNKVVNSDYKDTHADTKHNGSLANLKHVKRQYPHTNSQLSLQWPSSASDVANAVSVHQPSDKDNDGDVSKWTENTAVHETSLSSVAVGPMVDHPALLLLPTMAEECTFILTDVQPGSAIKSYDGTLENMSQSDDENNVLDDGSPNVPERSKTASMLDYPMQLKLSAYYPKRFGNITSTRDFKPEWFKDYPW